jgi:FAD:protein FMN transferase
MKIGFGAIGKGYAANKARYLMMQMGIESGMVNAGGDLITWGTTGHGEEWKIGLADPKKEKDHIAYLEIGDMAVVTSGDYERFSMINGVRYSHIIDPRTGYPCSGLKSVTIVCPDAEIADALATSVFVMGQEKGMKLINQMKDVDCILVNDRNEIITTDNIQLNYIN